MVAITTAGRMKITRCNVKERNVLPFGLFECCGSPQRNRFIPDFIPQSCCGHCIMMGKNCTLLQEEDPISCYPCECCELGWCGLFCCVITWIPYNPIVLFSSVFQRFTVYDKYNIEGTCVERTLFGICVPCSVFQMHEFLVSKKEEQTAFITKI